MSPLRAKQYKKLEDLANELETFKYAMQNMSEEAFLKTWSVTKDTAVLNRCERVRRLAEEL